MCRLLRTEKREGDIIVNIIFVAIISLFLGRQNSTFE